ncbi:MAG: hypothetical protein P4L84_03425 [Isosphaeraceae bacterium]|nr:hypothetical protein [Isosphaeraceae bacterium]
MFAFAGLALLLAAVIGPSNDLPAHGLVAVEALDVYDAPDRVAFRSGRLRRGTTVTIRDADDDGWLAIDAPSNSFEWIDEAAIDFEADGTQAVVKEVRTSVRSAITGARVPGPVVGQRTRGDHVRLVDTPALRLPDRDGYHVFRAILTGPGEVRYVRADGVERQPRQTSPPQEVQAAYLAQAPSGDIKNDLAQTEAMHRAIVRGPLEEWWLEPVKARYQALLPRANDSATASVIRERLAVVAKQEQMTRDALTFQSVLQRSRLRDGSLAAVRRRLAGVKRTDTPSFAAEGFIQPSSRKIEGEKALALIGPDGFAVAYLRVPPGLDTQSLLTRRVGVKGATHYDEKLHARVIAVSDIEPLERAR